MPFVRRTYFLSINRFVPLVTLIAATSVCRVGKADTKAALPATIADLKMTKAVTMYTPSTLESLLDGEAEAINRYGFKECAHAEYAPGGKGNQIITADIFVLGNAAQAYGLYSSQRSPNAKFMKMGAEGYKQDSALNFWKGTYYVRLAVVANNKAVFDASQQKLATAIAAKLTGTTAEPEIVKTLPAGFTPRSEQYRLSDIAAQAYIRNGMIAKYPTAGQQAELFVAQYPSAKEAADAYAKYVAYLTRPINLAAGGKATPVSGVGDKAVGVKTKFSGYVIASVKGKTLTGIRSVTDKPNFMAAATQLIKAAIAKAK